MANPWQEDVGPSSDPAPKTDLSRLMHPLLEQNLDKLAEVYLTNPPEERDKAIAQLLHELESSAAGGAAPEPFRAAKPAPASATTRAPVLCPACHRESRAEQRFCGFCGAPLYVDAPHLPDPPPEYQYAEDGGGILGLSSLPSEPAPLESDVQFLRDRTFGGVYATEEANPSRARYWIVALVILLLAGLGYREWVSLGRPESISEVMSSGHPGPPVRATAPPSAPAAPPSQMAQASQPAQPGTSPAEESGALPSGQQQQLTETDLPGSTEPPATTPAPQSPPALAPANPAAQPAAPELSKKPAATRPVTLASDTEARTEASAAASSNGAVELAQAQRYLSQRETTLAAEWLWKSVSKQNGQAALLLADLYTRGEGVPRSCEQARMLLVAAAKRGIEGAGIRLRTIEATCR